MDTTNLEQISKELKNSSLENETTSVEGTNSLRSYIKDTLNALHNTRLKKKVFEVLTRCLAKDSSVSGAILQEELQNLIKDACKSFSLRILMAFTEAPKQIKDIAMGNIEMIYKFVAHVLQDRTSSLLKQDGSSIAEEDIFNAIKILINLLQSNGPLLFKKVFEEDQTLSWEKSCIEGIISLMLTIIRSNILQKETLGLAGIALAHISNTLPIEYSLKFIHFLLNATVTTDAAMIELGFVKIKVSPSEKELSELVQVATVNGLITVCTADLLLATVELKNGESALENSLLTHSFTIITEACRRVVDAQRKFFCFQALDSWMDCIGRISLKEYHKKPKDDKALFQSSSDVSKHLLDIIWDNRDDMTDGIPRIVVSIFRKLLEQHKSEMIVLEMAVFNNMFIESLISKLINDPWYVKGRYSLLSEVFRHVSVSQMLLKDPSFPETLCKCFGASNLVSVANECYKAFISPSRKFCSEGNKHCDKDFWTSNFLQHFLGMIMSENIRSTDSCILYFIPTTLQQLPETFSSIKNALLEELTDTTSNHERSDMERNYNRRKLLLAYCTTFKFGRKFGLATINDVDMDILKECLVHTDDALRAEAMSVLCYNNKTTEPLLEIEEALLLDFLRANLNCACSSFRQTLYVSLKTLMARMRDSCIMLLRDYKKEMKKQRTKSSQDLIPERLSASVGLVEKIVTLSFECLFPGASFQRKKTGLQMLHTVLEAFSSPHDAIKRGRTAESLKSLTDWIAAAGRWNFIMIRNLKLLVASLEDQHDEIRELALSLSRWFDFNTMGLTPEFITEFGNNMVLQLSNLLESPKIRDAESGAILTEFFAQRFIHSDVKKISEIDGVTMKNLDLICDHSDLKGIMLLTFCLLKKIQEQVKLAYDDVLFAAVKRPVFGYIMAARRCFLLVIQQIQSTKKLAEIRNDVVNLLTLMVDDSLKACRGATNMALSVFAGQQLSEGASPSFADINDSLQSIMVQSRSFSSLNDEIGNQHCLELLSSFCWLNVKAATLYLGDIGKIMSLECLNAAERQEILSDVQFNQIGELFRETLVQCRHKGVIENSCVGFQKFCRSAVAIPSMSQMLNDWVARTIDAIDRNDMNSSVTKRSAGLPMFIQSIISACVSSHNFPFGTYIERLIEIAKRPIVTSSNTETDLPQVQAMNILKALYRDSSLGNEASKYTEDGLTLSIEGFASCSWSIRNAAQILLGALVPRMLGQRITQAEKSHHNSFTPNQFFTRYPKLEEFFVKILQAGTQQRQLADFLPALIPVITMLSKLRPCLDSRLNSKFGPLLTKLLSCRVFTVRKLAASALVLFMQPEEQEAFFKTLTLQINDATHSHNTIHGSLLVLKKLIEMNEDDSRFAEFLSSNEILSISNGHLRLGLNAESMASSVIFEILAMVIPRANRKDSRLKDQLNKILLRSIDNFSDYQIDGNRNIAGQCLAIKRLAQTIIGYIVHLQCQETGTAETLLTKLLSSSCSLLRGEAFHEIDNHLEEGKFIHEELKSRVFHFLLDIVDFSSYRTGDTILIDCCFNSGKDLQRIVIPEEKVLILLKRCAETVKSNCPSRILAACLPFMGLLAKYFCDDFADTACQQNELLDAIDVLTENLLIASAAEEREILRWSSLKTVKVFIKSLFDLYQKTNGPNTAMRSDRISKCCSRLIVSSLRLIQDEDENIRLGSCHIVAALNENNVKPMQSNLALGWILDFAAKRMWNNLPLIEALFQEVSFTTQLHLDDFNKQRSLMLFEQEGANLFSEELVFVGETAKCLKKIVTKIREKPLDKLNSNLHTFDALFSRIRQENVETLQSFIQVFGHNNPSNQMSCHGYFGNWKHFLAIGSCIYLVNVTSDGLSTVDKDNYQQTLQGILKTKGIHPFIEEEANRSIADLT